MKSICLLLATATALPAQFQTRLDPATGRAFEQYRKSAESGMNWVARFSAPPQPDQVTIAPSGQSAPVRVTNGLVHDWAAATVAPRAAPEKVLAVLQDYADYSRIFAPEVLQSRLLSRDGNTWRAYLRLLKKKVLTVVLDTEYEIEYRPLGGGRWALISRSTKIAEVDGDRQLPPGTGHGFLWRLNAYWLIEPRPDGSYIECRTLSLSRDIPASLGWAIRPIVSSLPRESLEATLEALLRALR